MSLQIDQRCSWHFVNGPWALGRDGIFEPAVKVDQDDGLGIQNYRFAFCKDQGFSDLQASFRLRHSQGHSDAGLIFRASDPQHFYMLHFPDCGQASRAQNFWVALSRMDASGVLKIIKLSYVQRVVSHPQGQWHDIEMQLTGNRLEVRIDGRGVFETDGLDDLKPGYIGLMSFGDAQIDKVAVQGEPVALANWTDEDSRRPCWFYPVPKEEFGQWQRPNDLLRLPDGRLLLSYTAQVHATQKNTELLTESSDNGTTWSKPELLGISPGDNDQWVASRLHITPGGRLVALIRRGVELFFAESPDAGRTFSEPVATNIEKSAALASLVPPPQAMMNLADGSMLMMLYGGSTYKSQELSVYTWGSLHCQAYTCRSTDDGRTWSVPEPMDNRGLDKDSKQIACNLDLTEPSVVEVEPGKLLALIRPIFSPWMWETWSQDGGKTWGPCVRGPFPGYAAPNMIRTSSGAILIAHRLPGLTVHYSSDGGMNWDQGTMIDSGLWAMGSMVEVEPDLVLYIYWDTNYSLMRGQFLRVTRSGLVFEPRF